jgi:hypothetical protein
MVQNPVLQPAVACLRLKDDGRELPQLFIPSSMLNDSIFFLRVHRIDSRRPIDFLPGYPIDRQNRRFLA